MGMTAKAASGPGKDNAGTAGKGLDAAIAAALDQSEEPRQDVVESNAADETTDTAEATAPAAESAGDNRESEDGEAEKPSKRQSPKDEPALDADKSFKAPEHWSHDDRTAFASLPPEGKSIVKRLARNLEGGFTRKSQELSDKARYADTVRSLFTDSDRAQMAQTGTDEVGVVRYLLGVQRFASAKPVDYVKWAMQNLGVTPEHLGLGSRNEHAAKAPKPDVDNLDELLADPAVKQLQAELGELRSWKEGFEREQHEFARRQHASETDEIYEGINEFRRTLDDDGQLKFPHFDAVHQNMGALMATVPELMRMRDGPEKLEKAYDMAVWANPELRRTFMDYERQRTIDDQQKRAAAERARKAAAVKPAVGVATAKQKPSSLDDAISTSLSKFGF